MTVRRPCSLFEATRSSLNHGTVSRHITEARMNIAIRGRMTPHPVKCSVQLSRFFKQSHKFAQYNNTPTTLSQPRTACESGRQIFSEVESGRHLAHAETRHPQRHHPARSDGREMRDIRHVSRCLQNNPGSRLQTARRV